MTKLEAGRRIPGSGIRVFRVYGLGLWVLGVRDQEFGLRAAWGSPEDSHCSYMGMTASGFSLVGSAVRC